MSFSQPSQPKPRAALSLAPMLDLLFLLLIFFVTTSSFRDEEHQIDVRLPAAQAATVIEPTRTEVTINVRADGAILVGTAEMQLPQLRAMLSQLVKDYPNERVIIRGDKAVVWDTMVKVMDAVRSANVQHIYFSTVKTAAEVER